MKNRILALLVVALLAFAACGGDGASTSSSNAASVGDREITKSEVSDALARFEETSQFEQLTSSGSPEEVRRQFEQGYVSQIVRRYVLQAEAEELGVSVSSDEVEQRIEEIKSDFPSEEEFDKAVSDQGLTEQQLDDLVRDQVLEDKIRTEVLSETGPSDEEVQAFYDENEANFSETEVSHILVKKKALADKLSGQLRSTKKSKLKSSFSAAAKKFSEDPGSASKGGSLGAFRPGQFVPEFEQAAARLDVGEVSKPVESQFGFHLIWVTGRNVAPLEEVREQITQQLSGEGQDKAFQDFMVEAYEDADITVNPRFGELDIETQRIVNADADDVPGAEDSGGETPEGEEPSAEPTPEQ